MPGTCNEATAQDGDVNEVDDLARCVRAEHRAVGLSVRKALEHAMGAGDALIKLRHEIRHGNWRAFLRDRCEINERTAQRYIQLAKGRQFIAANASCATDFTIEAALRLLGKQPKDPH